MIKTLQKRAFTLIELLVVIAIIGILASLIIVSLSGARSKATDTQLKNNARNIDTALAQYYQDQSTAAYPVSGVADVSTLNTASLLQPYMSSTTSQVFTHTGTDAKYISTAVSGANYAQAWTLKSSSESAIISGNGIYWRRHDRGDVETGEVYTNNGGGVERIASAFTIVR